MINLTFEVECRNRHGWWEAKLISTQKLCRIKLIEPAEQRLLDSWNKPGALFNCNWNEITNLKAGWG